MRWLHGHELQGLTPQMCKKREYCWKSEHRFRIKKEGELWQQAVKEQ